MVSPWWSFPAGGFFMVMETAKAAKDFIEAELEKYGTLEEMEKVSTCGHLFESEAAFAQAKGEQGVGIRPIVTFLGWQGDGKARKSKKHLVEDTLKVIKEEEDAERKKADAYEAAQWAKEERERRQAAEVVEKAERDRLAAIEAEQKAQAAKAFIEAELEKYGSWEEWQVSNLRDLIRDPSNFGQLKQRGPGIETIQSFLGWKSKSKIEDTRARGTSASEKASPLAGL